MTRGTAPSDNSFSQYVRARIRAQVARTYIGVLGLLAVAFAVEVGLALRSVRHEITRAANGWRSREICSHPWKGS